MHYVVYISSATPKLSEKELILLLNKARITNEALGVTGLLIYIDGNIVQLLEGEEKNINALYSKIAGDLRHTGILKLLSGPLAKRNFADWSMQFKSLSLSEAEQISGFKNLNRATFLSHPQGVTHPALKILDSFCKTNLH